MGELNYEQVFDILRREKSREDLQEIDKGFYAEIFATIKAKEVWIRSKQIQHSLASDPEFDRKGIELKNFHKILSELIDRRLKKILLLALSRTRIASTIINNDSFSREEELFFENCVKLLRSFRTSLGGKDSYPEMTSSTLTAFSSQESNSELDCRDNQKNANDSVSQDNKSDSDNKDIKETLEIKGSQNLDKYASTENKEFESSNIKEQVAKSSTDTTINPVSNTSKLDDVEQKQAKLDKQISQIQKVKFLSDMPRFYGPVKEVLGPYTEGQIVELPTIIANILIQKSRAEKI